ncbi:hypothetical protein PoB_001283200 [Plakobranchus ocellatus]|uniref:Uncharacterized protein n=1 Tax=Plakobranchus ocellatus TaxID=259542 RepID=A0AAV3YTN8_9GAST|nr:hypothetical protein PoB_001283200 [Plakobranchus ocellatus]
MRDKASRNTLDRYGWEILPHPGGMAFETEDDLISELRNWFDNLDVDFFRVVSIRCCRAGKKCIDLHGDYVEKKWKSELQSV